MKDVTEPMDEVIKKINKEYEKGREYHVAFYRQHLVLPKDILIELKRQEKEYETENVRDITENYEFLTTPVKYPESYLAWLKQARREKLDEISRDPVLKGGFQELSRHEDNQPYEELTQPIPYSNQEKTRIPVRITLENVTLNNVKIIKKQMFEAMQISIQNPLTPEQNIQGIYVYRDEFEGVFKGARKQAEKVLNSDPLQAFELYVTPMHQSYRLLSKERRERPKTLNITDITHYNGRKSQEIIPIQPVGELITT